ncbi:hypothetical protein FRC08_007087 [Ceratobasidium sp. 394]|nr:hypothetical protein FRC08_007087 [Ceratobasidium sp. 394]KAG9086245.1 hypothetical protein FS749_003785 [Ceratobasidium sp. UAMH 11750]
MPAPTSPIVSSRFNGQAWDGTWGATFPMYLSSMNPFFPIASNTGLKSAKNVIRHIERASLPVTSLPTFTHFYPILYLQSNPRDLRILGNTRIVSGCVELLRQYTEDIKHGGKGLLSHSFGFYCFRAMILGMQVGILTHTGTFDSFIEEFGHLDRADHVCAALDYFVDGLIIESDDRGDFLELLGAADLPDTERSFLGSVGGFLNTDVHFLLEALWKDRDVLTYISTSFPLHGWAITLWVTGRHMLRALDLQINETYEWGHLRALCFRYSLFTSSQATFYLENICNQLLNHRCNSQRECMEFLVDQDDAENFINAYISRVTPFSDHPIYGLDMASLYIDFIPQEDILKPAHLMPALIKATVSQIWVEWDEYPDADLSKDKSFISYCTGIFQALCKMFQLHSDRTLCQITSALHSNDFVELIGRVVLSPLVESCDLMQYLREEIDEEFTTLTLERWDKLLQSLLTLTYWFPHKAQPELSASDEEWKKTQRWLSTYRTAQLPSQMVKYVDKCWHVWNTLGLAFGYFSPDTAGEERLCAYARCPKPVLGCNSGFACSLCLETPYCGHECQAKHWDGISPESHRNNCVGFADHTSTDVPQ